MENEFNLIWVLKIMASFFLMRTDITQQIPLSLLHLEQLDNVAWHWYRKVFKHEKNPNIIVNEISSQSTAVMVGDAQDWLEDIKDKALNLKISAGHEADADLGPLISPEAKKRVESLIQSAVDEGAEVDIYS